MHKLSIIIPVFNEENTIAKVIDVVSKLKLINNIQKEIIIINDASSDNSLKAIEQALKELKSEHIRLINHTQNMGKGGAIQTGIQLATGDYTIIQDADLELDPNEINRLLEKVENNEADIVYGSRFLNKASSGGTGLSNLANKVLTGLSNLIFRIKITDMETCYKLVPSPLFKSLKLVEKRFGFEPEITARLAKYRDLRWAEVAITYQARTEEQGKKIGWKDGFRAMWCILKYGIFTRK